ncbi:MAG: hypothetical protein IPM91_04500 [Bacteroidetes bacterium]|nr:hypothetical protein [Bacteroidota bacterium]
MKKENAVKQVGLWLGQAEAHFIHPTLTTNEPETTTSELESQVRHKGESGDGTRLGGFRSTNNENHKQHREQDALHKYYKELDKATWNMMKFTSLVPFRRGVSCIILKEDAHFSSKNIHFESAGSYE